VVVVVQPSTLEVRLVEPVDLAAAAVRRQAARRRAGLEHLGKAITVAAMRATPAHHIQVAAAVAQTRLVETLQLIMFPAAAVAELHLSFLAH
jgi:hypothetical protein